MAQPVTAGAQLQCSLGAAVLPLVVNPAAGVELGNVPPATLPDDLGGENMATFGVCSSLGNPTVAAATAAALGVLTPMPCVPAIVSPWLAPVQDVAVGDVPAVHAPATCQCAWGGVIQATALPSTVDYT